MTTNNNDFLAKSGYKYICETCDYRSNKKYNYDKHLLSLKHNMTTNSNVKLAESSKKMYNCETCEKKFGDRAGLWRHNKKACKQVNVTDNISDKELIVMLVKQNSELMELLKNGTTNNNSHNNHSNNKTFNLQFFLNETCKDAINISEFVSSIKPTLEDLENTGRQGYIQGISNIILKKLNSLEEYIRPIHCSDLKREVLYIKENDQWSKETEEKPVLTKAIKVIANENIKNIKEWKEMHPDCTEANSQKNNLYLKIVSNSMSGLDKEECTKNVGKIISNVAKEVTIQKEN
jgi:hypothetical protein